jgi:hypothetical protein
MKIRKNLEKILGLGTLVVASIFPLRTQAQTTLADYKSTDTLVNPGYHCSVPTTIWPGIDSYPIIDDAINLTTSTLPRRVIHVVDGDHTISPLSGAQGSNLCIVGQTDSVIAPNYLGGFNSEPTTGRVFIRNKLISGPITGVQDVEFVNLDFAPTTGDQECVELSNSSDLLFYNNRFQGRMNGNNPRYGITIADFTSDVNIKNNVFSGFYKEDLPGNPGQYLGTPLTVLGNLGANNVMALDNIFAESAYGIDATNVAGFNLGDLITPANNAFIGMKHYNIKANIGAAEDILAQNNTWYGTADGLGYLTFPLTMAESGDPLTSDTLIRNTFLINGVPGGSSLNRIRTSKGIQPLGGPVGIEYIPFNCTDPLDRLSNPLQDPCSPPMNAVKDWQLYE